MSRILTTIVPGAPRLAIDHAGDGPFVLFLHGIGGHRTNWRDQIEALADRYFAAAWDLRGYGDSDDYEGLATFTDVRQDLLRVLDHFGVRTAHIVGLSLGGLIAQDFYRCHPGRVRSLVLANTRNTFQRHDNDEFLRRREAPLMVRTDAGPARAGAGPIHRRRAAGADRRRRAPVESRTAGGVQRSARRVPARTA